jgi:hypothetical protein
VSPGTPLGFPKKINPEGLDVSVKIPKLIPTEKISYLFKA